MKPGYTFPTEHKSKIPHSLSFPIGAERISEALQDVPQSKALSISLFHYGRAHRPNEPVSLYPVLEAQYSYSRPNLSSSNAMIESGWFRPKWRLTVRPVPREKKNAVKQLLLVEGLPRVRSWLLRHASLTRAEAYHRITVVFDECTDALQVEECSRA